MATSMNRIKKALTREFSPESIKLSRTKSGRISGWIISRSFEGQSTLDRQHRIWQLLDEQLEMEDNARIIGIFAVTPLEHENLFQDRAKR